MGRESNKVQEEGGGGRDDVSERDSLVTGRVDSKECPSFFK